MENNPLIDTNYVISEEDYGGKESPLWKEPEFFDEIFKTRRFTQISDHMVMESKVFLIQREGNQEPVVCKVVEHNRRTGKPETLLKLMKLHNRLSKHKFERVIECRGMSMKTLLNRSQTFYFLFPYYEGGDLSEYVRNRGGLFEQEARFFFKEMALVLKELHDLGIAHGDIKPQNFIFLTKKRKKLVLIDFECFSDTPEVFGIPDGFSPMFAPPEIVIPGLRGHRDPKISDIYLMATTLLHMLSLHVVKFEFFNRIYYKEEDVLSAFPFCYFSTGLKTLIMKMLQHDGAHRCKVDGILSDPWLNDEECEMKNSASKMKFAEIESSDLNKKEMYEFCKDYFDVIEKDDDFKRVVFQKLNFNGTFENHVTELGNLYMKDKEKLEEEQKEKKKEPEPELEPEPEKRFDHWGKVGFFVGTAIPTLLFGVFTYFS